MPSLQHIYDTTPLWILALGFFLLMLISREIGALTRRRHEVVGGLIEADAEGFLINSVLGLLALLIAFTFSMALERYDERRELVMHEANALGTLWLRSQLMDAPDGERVRSVLRVYIDSRVAFGHASDTEEEVLAQHKSEVLQVSLWNATVQAIRPFRTTELAGLMVSSANRSFDLSEERYATHRARIPLNIFRMLLIYALVTAGMVGFQRAAHRKATTLMFVLLALAVSLIIDLDRPAIGAIRVPQQPMLDLQESIRTPRAAMQGDALEGYAARVVRESMSSATASAVRMPSTPADRMPPA
jgi:hypothetical protein